MIHFLGFSLPYFSIEEISSSIQKFPKNWSTYFQKAFYNKGRLSKNRNVFTNGSRENFLIGGETVRQ
jgi:hypothetical protein